MEHWKARDPIQHLRADILKARLAQKSELDGIDAAMLSEIEEAVEFAKNSPYPDVRELTTDVYAVDNERSVVR